MIPEFLLTGDGACADAGDPDAWTVEGRDRDTNRRREAARQICATCPLREPCDRWATEHREVGMWGGRTEHQRRTAARKLVRSP